MIHDQHKSLWIIVFIFAVLFAGCLGFASYKPGIYEGEGRGFYGTISLRVFVSRAGIEDIEILEHNESPFSVSVMEELIELALEYNTSNLDAISGATVSSEGFLSALDAALRLGTR